MDISGDLEALASYDWSTDTATNKHDIALDTVHNMTAQTRGTENKTYETNNLHQIRSQLLPMTQPVTRQLTIKDKSLNTITTTVLSKHKAQQIKSSLLMTPTVAGSVKRFMLLIQNSPFKLQICTFIQGLKSLKSTLPMY